MGQMIYTKEGSFEVLDKGKKGDYYWVIVSYGTHPCAYVAIPKGHPQYNKDYDDVPIDCHGGLTYCDKEYHNQTIPLKNYYWYGWDYNHGEDFAGYYLTNPDLNLFGRGNKKWTTEEIREEVFSVIRQFKKLESRNGQN